MPISLSLPSLCCVRPFLTLVCLSVCPSLPFLFSPPSPFPGWLLDPGKTIPPKPCPRPPPFSPPRAPGVPLHLPTSCQHLPPSLCRPLRPGSPQWPPVPLLVPLARSPRSCLLLTSPNEVGCPAPALLQAPHDLFTCPPHQPLSKGTRSHQAPAT